MLLLDTGVSEKKSLDHALLSKTALSNEKLQRFDLLSHVLFRVSRHGVLVASCVRDGSRRRIFEEK